MTLSHREHNAHQDLAKRLKKNAGMEKRQAQPTGTQSQRVIVVTRIVGTTVVTGTPPGANTKGNGRASSSVQAASSSTRAAAPTTTSEQRPPSSSSPPTSSTPEPTPTPSPTPSTSSTRQVITSDTRSLPSLLIGSTRLSSSVRSSSSAPSSSTRTSLAIISSSSVTSSSASSTGVDVNAVGGNKGDAKEEESGGLSTGGIVGVVAGVLLGIAAILLLAGALWKRKNRNQAARPYSSMAPFGGEKKRQRYRDSSVLITDKSFTGGRDEGDFGNVNTYDNFGYPPGSGEKAGSRRPDTVFSQTGNFAGVGRSNFVIAEDYDDRDAQHVSQGQMREIGGAGTRDLTGANAYRRYTDTTPPNQYSPMFGSESAYPIQHAYYQDGQSSHGHGGYSEDGRHTPTDYYGQAMSPSGVAIAEEYADFPAHMQEASQSTAGKAPIQGGWQASAGVAGAGATGGLMVTNGLGLANTRSLSPVERSGRNENVVYAQNYPGRVQLQDPQAAPSMPQLPPLSLDSINSPLYSGFSDPGIASRRTSVQTTQEVETGGANLHRKSSSAQPTALMYGQKKTDEELRRGYADLARAAEIDAPSATREEDLLPPMMPERYQHGRPLSPLFEVETPEVSAATLHDERNPFGSGSARISGSSLRPAIAVRQSSDTRPASELRASNGVPSAKFPPPSPGVSLPESPASYAANGPVTPRAGGIVYEDGTNGSVNSTPEYSFKVHPPGASAVSLDAFPSTPQRHPLAMSAGPSPASTIQSSSGLPPPPPIGASRLSIASSFSDAYDGI